VLEGKRAQTERSDRCALAVSNPRAFRGGAGSAIAADVGTPADRLGELLAEPDESD
jgi:hypothetical protein